MSSWGEILPDPPPPVGYRVLRVMIVTILILDVVMIVALLVVVVVLILGLLVFVLAVVVFLRKSFWIFQIEPVIVVHEVKNNKLVN